MLYAVKYITKRKNCKEIFACGEISNKVTKIQYDSPYLHQSEYLRLIQLSDTFECENIILLWLISAFKHPK